MAKRTTKIKAGDIRRDAKGNLHSMAILMSEFLGPAFVSCRQFSKERLSYTGFFEMGDAFSRSGAKCLPCPTCGLYSIWNFRVDREPTKAAKRFLEGLGLAPAPEPRRTP